LSVAAAPKGACVWCCCCGRTEAMVVVV
jgi:hypothetical protein